MTYSDSSKTTFAYNGEGKRLTKVDSSGTIKYLYDQSKVAIERDVSNNNLATYTHEGGSLFYDLISVDRTNSCWYLFDGLGSVTEMVDSDEDTQNSYRYEAFGQIKSSSENVTNYYKFVGAFGVHHDSALALYFMQARYYKAAIGRFISVDPMPGAPQDPLSLHRYLYVRNNPVNNADPSGLSWWDWVKGIGIAGAAGAVIQWIGKRCVSILEAGREEVKKEAEPCWRMAREDGEPVRCNECCERHFVGKLKTFDCKKGCENAGLPWR